MGNKRVFLLVLDSVGCGECPDSADYGDAGSNTIAACAVSKKFNVPFLASMGLFNIEGIGCKEPVKEPCAAFGKMREASKGKDTTTGHWEIAGLISERPMPTFPNGFPKDIIDKYAALTGHEIICNKVYSGTEVIKDYGKEQIEKDALIVYTSADSVFQVAAHTDKVQIDELYRCCEIARDMLQGEYGVGRVIARPFNGEWPYTRTTQRHDYSLEPTGPTLPLLLKNNGLDCIGVGKINDIFAGVGMTEYVRTVSNHDGMEKTYEYAKRDFNGLCFVNLVDFDMLYGHRNDVDGYAQALTDIDSDIKLLTEMLGEDDIMIITADHGCDPSTESTDHSREYVPLLIYGKHVKKGTDLKTRNTFSDIAATISDYFEIENSLAGTSFLKEIFL